MHVDDEDCPDEMEITGAVAKVRLLIFLCRVSVFTVIDVMGLYDYFKRLEKITTHGCLA